MNEEIIRFGVSMPKSLLERFDEAIKRRGFAKRSEAIRYLIMKFIYEEEHIKEDEEGIGILIVVYDHKEKNIEDRIVDLQHEYLNEIRANLHIHINKRKCSEIIILRGKVSDIKYFAKKLTSIKGILYDNLIILH